MNGGGHYGPHPKACVCQKCCNDRIAARKARQQAMARARRQYAEEIAEKLYPSPPAKKLNKHIRATRMWFVRNDFVLVSANFVPWVPGQVTEAKHVSRLSLRASNLIVHEAPKRNCLCGLWGTKINKRDKTFWHFVNEYQRNKKMYEQHKVIGVAVGTVNLWGRIIPHKHGYRAQYGYPEKLFTIGANSDTMAVNLAELYGVPAEQFTWENWRNK